MEKKLYQFAFDKKVIFVITAEGPHTALETILQRFPKSSLKHQEVTMRMIAEGNNLIII